MLERVLSGEDTVQLRNDDLGDEVGVVHRGESGLTWIPYPDTQMERASHAHVEDGDVWLGDPLDAAGLDEELDAPGNVAGIVVLADTHARHADCLPSAIIWPSTSPPVYPWTRIQ